MQLAKSSHKFVISSPDMKCWIAEYIVCFLVINAFIIFEGRKAFLRHVRGGVELPEIIRDDNYDFNFQVSRVIKPK